jgi:hypothetical protein
MSESNARSDAATKSSRRGKLATAAWVTALNGVTSWTTWRRRRRLASSGGREAATPAPADGDEHGALRGWRILGDAYTEPSLLDGLSLEWDYFMIHGEGWTGIVGYVLADPRRKLGDGARGPLGIPLALTPSGGSVAVAGEFVAAQKRIADFVHFGVDHTKASSSSRRFEASDPRTGYFATLVPVEEPDGRQSLRLTGRTEHYEWDLEIRQDWADRDQLRKGPDAPFSAVHGRDVGLLGGEHFTVDMLWPRTRVVGEIVRRDTGERFAVNGHGYREDSFGRFSFATDGWDFAVFSSEDSGVQFAWQAYRNGLDHKYLDVSFLEDGLVRAIRFRTLRGELEWRHAHWRFDPVARQFQALDTEIVADNGEYRVEARIEIGERQAPLLSAATVVTNAYVIMEHFPHFEGRITNLSSGEVVAEFSGQGGGELASPRRLREPTAPAAGERWGSAHYGHSRG